MGIPKEYGGRGAEVKECLAVMEAASYESLPLSLTMGINIALFLEPVAKYAQDGVKEDLFSRFLNQQNMGGLMITEPDYGSDALNMQTYNEKMGSQYHIQGNKALAGINGAGRLLADYIPAKTKLRRIGKRYRFLHLRCAATPPKHTGLKNFITTSGYIPSHMGRILLISRFPNSIKLEPESTGLKMMMDLLHRSRFHFPGMGMGFIRRNLDEAIKHCYSRIVGGKPLISFDQVKHQISKIQSAFTVCSAMCSRSAEYGRH